MINWYNVFVCFRLKKLDSNKGIQVQILRATNQKIPSVKHQMVDQKQTLKKFKMIRIPWFQTNQQAPREDVRKRALTILLWHPIREKKL